uniref:COMM domain-containing protein 5 n=1 Tax=Xenopsylla cheopis TaxID=163159 RepID=A0A6M2DFE1_XENCH
MSKFVDELLWQLKPYNNYIPNITKTLVRPLIQLAGRSLDGSYINEDPLTLIQNRTGISEDLAESYTIILIIMQLFFQTPSGSIKPNELQQIFRDLNFKNDVIEDLSNTLFGAHAQQLSLGFDKSLNTINQIKYILWKIDISLINSAISNLTKPKVILRMYLSNGKSKTFEITSKMLHKLRLNIALILRNMFALENKSILKHL